MAHGHPDPLGYSFQKIQLLFTYAMRSRARDEANADLRFLRLAHLAIASTRDKRAVEAYKKTENGLLRAMGFGATPTDDDPKANRNKMLQSLLKAGAKRAYGSRKH